MALTREELYKRFGPVLLEAVALVVKDEINILRQQHGLADRTDQQIMNALETKLGTLNKYNWMDNP